MSEKQELNRIALRTPAVLAAVVVVLDLFAYMVGTGSPRDIATTVFVGLNLAFACMVGHMVCDVTGADSIDCCRSCFVFMGQPGVLLHGWQ